MGRRGWEGRGSESKEGWRREKGVEGWVTRQASRDGVGICTLYSVPCGRSSSRSEEERSSRLELEREDVLLEIRQLDRKEGREGEEKEGSEGKGGEGRKAKGWRMV